MKKIKSLVTGGAGFIGSNLVDLLLKKGHQVTVLDNFSTGRNSNLSHIKTKKLKIINIDIASKKKMDKYFNKIDYVFHLAGLADIVPSIENPKKYFESNVLGTLNVLESARKNKITKFIYAASASCYGIPKKFPTDELSKISPMYPYAFTKWQGEELVKHWSQVFGVPFISLRFFNVYGPRSRTTGAYGAVFGVFLAQKLAKKPLTIVGNGNQTRDFIFVKDLADGMFKAALSRKKNQIYNIAGGKEVSVNLIAKMIGGKKIFLPKRPGEPDRSLANINKIRKELKWKPKTSLKKGVQSLIKDINHWKDAPVWTAKKIKKATLAWFKLLK